jgi:hypothetical protein
MARRIFTLRRRSALAHSPYGHEGGAASFIEKGRHFFLSWYQEHHGGKHGSGRRGFATYHGDHDKNDTESQTPQIILQKLGDLPYGSREYKLVVRRVQEEQGEFKTVHMPVASLRGHRNIVFGAQLFGETAQNRSLSEVCLPLLDVALEDASCEGEQPQAMATLHGLCDWVAQCDSDNHDNESETLKRLKSREDDLVYQAVSAMATGIPRPGHSVVGQGTFRDGQEGWEALAEEFIKKELAEEVELYKARGGTVVVIEHLADTQPNYLRSAGGAIARLFFL